MFNKNILNIIMNKIENNKINSPLKNGLKNIAGLLSTIINNKIPYIKPNYITTFGLILHAFGLLNLLKFEFGLFVIETKNMKGWIFGNTNQKQWTQKIFKYTGKFQNPLHQNYKHTQTLASCLTIPNEFIYSVVVFIGDSTFKTKMPDNVTYARGCVEYIKTKKVVHFSKEQVSHLNSEIEAGRLTPSLKTNLAHSKHVKTIVGNKSETKKVINNVVEIKESLEKLCLQCGSEMSLKQAKKGKYVGNQFWGCTNFPKCRKVVNL